MSRRALDVQPVCDVHRPDITYREQEPTEGVLAFYSLCPRCYPNGEETLEKCDELPIRSHGHSSNLLHRRRSEQIDIDIEPAITRVYDPDILEEPGQLEAAYHECDEVVADLARRVGVDATVVSNRLEEYGIREKKEYFARKLERLVADGGEI